MQLPADMFLAFRYLRPKRTFISVITFLSVLGPVLGVAMLVIVAAVMSGFDRDIRDRILGMQAHLQVFPRYSTAEAGALVLADADAVLTAVREVGAAGSPLIEGPVLIQVRDSVATKYLKGIDPRSEQQVTDLSDKVRGSFELAEGQALIGEEMALELGLRRGDHLLIHSPSKLTRNIHWDEDGRITVTEPDEAYLPEEVTIVGTFAMGLYEYDTSIIFVHLDQAADLFGFEWGSATSVHASVPDPFRLNGLAERLRARLPACRIVTWQEANQVLFGALAVEKRLTLFLLAFIVIVAAFGIAGTLITVAVQKTREIGILKAVGMSGGTVARIFILQGAVIGVIGTALGTGLGLLVLHYRNEVAGLLAKVMKVEIFPKKLYHLSEIPAFTTRGDILLIVGLSLIICVAASLVPALYACSLSPAKALQEEN